MLRITPDAIGHIKDLLKHKKGYGIRIDIDGGPCSGLEYSMEFAPNPESHDMVNVVSGIRLFVDPKTHVYISGKTLEYVENISGGKFVIDGRFMTP